jgi:pimeloyl-ACP methyl ester carboxylesterase
LTLAAFPALLILDGLLGLAYRTDTTAHVSVIMARSGKTHRAIVVFPGYLMPGATVGRAFAQYVGVEDALVVVDYAERGVNPAQIYDEVMAALRGLRPTELRIYGASMGGMLGKLFLDRYRQAGTPYGKVVLILDSAPAKTSNIRRPGLLLHLSCWYRGGPLSSVAWALANEVGSKPPIDAATRPDLVRSSRNAGLWVGMPAATSQACFIARFDPLIKGELLDVAQQVVFLHGFSPNDDPVVRISEAIAAWRVAFPKLVVVTVQGRAGRWHLPLVEYPRETVSAMNAE